MLQTDLQMFAFYKKKSWLVLFKANQPILKPANLAASLFKLNHAQTSYMYMHSQRTLIFVFSAGLNFYVTMEQ